MRSKHVPGHWPNYTGVRNYGARRDIVRGKLSGEGIRLFVLWTGSIGRNEVESREYWPPALMRVKMFSFLKVGKVFMVCPDDHGQFNSLQPVVPVLESQINSKQLTVTSLVVPCYGRQSTRKQGCSLLSCSLTLERTAPTPESEESTSMVNCFDVSGWMRMGALGNFSCNSLNAWLAMERFSWQKWERWSF